VATGKVKLPPGFELDPSSNLPPGFVLDSGAQAPRPTPFQPSDVGPTAALQSASPSNLLKLGGVAAANAPGIAGTVLSAIPGLGNPSQIVPSLQNVAANPRQALTALKRTSDVSAGLPLSPIEKAPAIAGQAAGTGLEMMIPSIGGAPLGEQTAQRAGMRVLGFTKRFLKNEKMLNRAEQTSQTMLDQGVIKPLGSATGTLERISDLSDRSGKRIGEILETLDAGQPLAPNPSKEMGFPSPKPQGKGRFFDPNRAIADLNDLRPVDDSGNVLRGGLYNQINRQIDAAIGTVKAHGNKPITLKSANQIKGLLQSGVNFNTGKGPNNLMDHLIAGRFRQSVDSQLDEAAAKLGDPKLSREFLEHKRIYSHAMNAEDPIFNRISSELGNKNIGITDWIALAPDFATGNPAAAIAMLTGKRALERFGPSITAVVANKLAKLGISKGQAAAATAPPLSQALSRRSTPGAEETISVGAALTARAAKKRGSN
jgi:hypothetical protein